MNTRISTGIALISALVLLSTTANAGASGWTPTPDFDASSNQVSPFGSVAVTARGTAVASGDGVALTLGASGRVVKSRRLPIDAPLHVTTFGSDNVVFAGTVYAKKGPQLLATSRPGVALGSASSGRLQFTTLPATGQFVVRVAGNRRGDVAILTSSCNSIAQGTESLCQSAIWLRDAPGKHFRRALTRPRIEDLALGARGDLLMMSTVNWKAGRGDIVARYRTTAGTWQPQQKLGTGSDTRFQAFIDRRGRQLLAWHDGDTTAFTSAAAGGRFAPAAVLTKSNLLVEDLEAGNAVTGTQFVRIAAAPNDRAMIAWTHVDGDRYVVRSANIVDRALSAAQDVTPVGQQAVLADAAVASNGSAVVLSHDFDLGIVGATRLRAADVFGAPESVTTRYSTAITSNRATAAIRPDGKTAYASFQGNLVSHMLP